MKEKSETKNQKSKIAAILLLALAAPLLAADSDSNGFYRAEDVPVPEGSAGEVGAMGFTPSGKLMAAFHRAGVHLYDPETGEWALFADALHTPLGILPISDDEAIVAQRPELTRIKDTDGDGRADLFRTITDDYGVSGNYHEFLFGPVRDAEGNLFVAPSCASNGAGVRHETRGPYRPRGKYRSDHGLRSGHYSPVPYRGWMLKVTPDGQTIPWAAGLRQPNGLVIDPDGRLFATDNHGSWNTSSSLFHVEKGKFYGHAMSLVWRPDFEEHPLDVPVRRLDKMRTRAAVVFPHGSMANSPAEPVIVPPADQAPGFAPFAGQMIVGEMNRPRLVRVVLEEVAGHVQGAAVPFYDGHGLRLGNNRLAFGPDGDLWAGHTKREQGWAGSTGIQRITRIPGSDAPFEVHRMTLTDDGFDLTFTRPVDPETAANPATYQFQCFYYRYHRLYGSHKYDLKPVQVESVEVSPDRRRVAIQLADLTPGRIYELRIDGLKAEDGTSLLHDYLAYTLNYLRDGTGPVLQPASTIIDGDEALEAEAAQASAGVQAATDGSGYSGDGYVAFDEGADQRYIEWWVHLEEGGRFQLTTRYAPAKNPAALNVNINMRGHGGPLQLPAKQQAGGEAWTTVSRTIPLDTGDNIIRLEPGEAGGVPIDRIEIKRLP